MQQSAATCYRRAHHG